MIYELTVPPAVPGVDEIRILEWHGGSGDSFGSGDLIVELETHKAVVEVRAGQAGILRQIFAEAGDWKGVGMPLAIFTDEAHEDVPTDASGLTGLAVELAVT